MGPFFIVPRPDRLQPTLHTFHISPGRKWRNAWDWNSSEEFEHNLHTCKAQISEHLEKATSFYVDLSKLLLEDARW